MDAEDAIRAIAAAQAQRDEELRTRFDRSLSISDALVDRWERAETLGFGAGASIYGSALVYGEVTVGEQTWIGPFVLLDGSGGGLSIGSTCSISAGVHVYTHDTVRWALSGGEVERRTAAVTIGDRCHIGAQAVIAPGVHVGDGSVVGANSFVNRSVPPGTVVAGSPARRIGHVVGTGSDVQVVIDEIDVPQAP